MRILALDGALARRPTLLLVDELAHSNAPGARHPKRWQDVVEALDAGIDLRQVRGTGPAGRIGHDDLDAIRADGPRLFTGSPPAQPASRSGRGMSGCQHVA